jgi:hypothetical protein
VHLIAKGVCATLTECDRDLGPAADALAESKELSSCGDVITPGKNRGLAWLKDNIRTPARQGGGDSFSCAP